MDKYMGCNKVDSVSYTPQTPKEKTVKKSKRNLRSFLARLCVACLLVAGICATAYLPALSPCRETLKSVVCYDMFGHDDVGTAPIISKLVKAS